MSKKAKPSLILELGEKGGTLEFHTPDEVVTWLTEETAKWQWLSSIPESRNGPAAFNQIHGQINPILQQWRQAVDDSNASLAPIASIKSSVESRINSQGFWLSSSEIGAFLLKLSGESSPTAAAGAYIALGGTYTPQNQPQHPQFIEGVLQAFLFRNEIEWTATTHREALENLKRQYSGNISVQKKNAEQLAETNQVLNAHFSKELKEQKAKLDTLHEEQTKTFSDLIAEHEKNLKAIEDAYDQKLALRKPVEYWDSRRVGHNWKALIYAIISLVVGWFLFDGLGGAAHDLFLNLKPEEQPKMWQVGVFAVAAFFAIWLERILVRLFVSNMHLATDAAERVTMLQTYLSIIREGSEFAPDDKKLILERLFKPATDGMVKDDGAPPTLVELLSRK
ncbi:hypothetical protein FEF65_11150 [Mariprofundus erugo]|uniref:DUF6161 domain-containing protein n=1 Tax=Mariprofundus erugo TaxID=2528639 RepID=A0A5R9GQ80_9PROT|nr:DUF6161 domain-containing protein [Mariprofundus erugo]TLS66142.1 hypothetical protein FEF65_11150 [Mariprofundus erugo]